MKSKLSIFVSFFGVLISIGYLYYDYKYHGEWITGRIPTQATTDTFFHIIIFSTFIGSLISAYLINERKKLLEKTMSSEQQLKRAAHEWSATFDSMPYGVLLTDSERNIIRANQHVANLAGIPARALVFREKCYSTLCKNDKPFETCPARKAFKTRKTESFEYFNEEQNKFFTESITPMFDEKGDIISYVHVLVDITNVKEKENKLIQSKDAFFNMLKDTDAAYKELRGVYNSLIVAFSNIIDAKSPWTRGHSTEVSNYAVAIARELNLDETEINTLRTAALLHDIGKIGTYDLVLDKPDRLSEDEITLIKKHTVKGEDILKPIKGLEEILPIVRSHHEKLDGSGYPDRLSGDDIPLLARILCVADSYDAMISNRPYRPACGREYAVTELRRHSGTQFDPYIVEAFLNTLTRTESPLG